MGISNISSSPDRILGWAWYLYVESFGSLMVALFWSFVSDSTTPESAKRGYSAIAIGGQMGGLTGPLLAQQIIGSYGTGAALILAVGALCLLVGFVFIYVSFIREKDRSAFGKNRSPLEGKPKAGFMEGFRLLISRPYLFGIFSIIALYEILITILDFHFKVLASNEHLGENLVQFLFKYAISVNVVALAALLFGAGAIGRKLGVGRTLLILPAFVLAAFFTLKSYPVLWVAFAIMVACKGVNYSLIQPTKEQLYLPTTKESRYKAKAWIDMFGGRLSKGTGSYINSFRGILGPETFMVITVTASVGLVGLWVFAALFVGKIHAKAIKEDRLVC
jgi:AAA family ATP:ADP antiporter